MDPFSLINHRDDYVAVYLSYNALLYAPELTPRARKPEHAAVKGCSSSAQSTEHRVGIPASGHEPGASQQVSVTGLSSGYQEGRWFAIIIIRLRVLAVAVG